MNATTVETNASHAIMNLVLVLKLKLNKKQFQHPNNG